MATTYEKLKCIRREISFRKLVYPARVAKGGMERAEAERELATMLEIEKDYSDKYNEEIGQGELPI